MNKTSNFPTSIDDRIFFQDINLNQLSTYNEYQEALTAEQYSKAASIIQSADITTFSAWLLNYFDGKLLNIETEAVAKKAIVDKYEQQAKDMAAKLYLTYYGSKPTTLSNNITWIE